MPWEGFEGSEGGGIYETEKRKIFLPGGWGCHDTRALGISSFRTAGVCVLLNMAQAQGWDSTWRFQRVDFDSRDGIWSCFMRGLIVIHCLIH